VKRHSIIMLCIFSLLAVNACSKPAAEVNGEKISMKTFRRALAARMRQHSAAGTTVSEKQLREAVMERLIGDRIILQAAREKGISVTDQEVDTIVNRMKDTFGLEALQNALRDKDMTMEEYRAGVREKLIIDKFINSLVPDDSIREEQIREYYKNSPRPFMMPERVHVRLIQAPTKEEADSIVERIKKKGNRFDKVADALKKEGKIAVTEYGWVNPSLFSDDIADALRTIKKGSFGGPYKGRDGYYILRVRDRQKERPKTFEEAHDEIRRLLLTQRRQAMMTHLIAEKRKKADIRINID